MRMSGRDGGGGRSQSPKNPFRSESPYDEYRGDYRGGGLGGDYRADSRGGMRNSQSPNRNQPLNRAQTYSPGRSDFYKSGGTPNESPMNNF